MVGPVPRGTRRTENVPATICTKAKPIRMLGGGAAMNRAQTGLNDRSDESASVCK